MELWNLCGNGKNGKKCNEENKEEEEEGKKKPVTGLELLDIRNWKNTTLSHKTHPRAHRNSYKLISRPIIIVIIIITINVDNIYSILTMYEIRY